MTQTPFQRALDGYEDAIFQLPAHRRRECIDRTLVHMRRTLPSDYRRMQRYEFRRLANDGTVCQHHAIVDAVNAFPAMRDRCVVSVAQAHRQRLWWLPFLLIWNSVTSGIDVFEYAVNWWLVRQRWMPRFALGPVLASFALICSDVRRTQASGSRVPSWCLAWQRAPIVGLKVCAWRIGWLQGWQWLRRKTEAPSPQDPPDYSFLPSALRVALAALALCAVLWPQHADAHVMVATITGAGAAFQVQTDGSDNNAGYFNAGGGSAGTDYSQQASAQVTIDGATITATVHSTTTQLTIAGTTVASTWNRNGVRITGGTATAGLYEITAVDVPNNRITLDRSAGTSTQTAIGTMGGALASPGQCAALAVGDNTNHIKAGTYSVTSASTNVAGGCWNNASRTFTVGFQSARGDYGTSPVLQASGISTFTLWTVSGDSSVFNVTCDAALLTSGRAWATARSLLAYVSAKNATNSGIAGVSGLTCYRALATGCTTTGFGIAQGHHLGVESYSHTVTGISLSNAGDGASFSLSYSNSGASSDGIAATFTQTYFCNSVVHGNGRDGVRFYLATLALNVIAEANGAYGFNNATATPNNSCVNRATYNNTSGAKNGTFLMDINPITGSGSFFTNAAAGDFSLNNTSGAGASLRASGYPGAFPRGTTTGYLDIGAAQHPDPGTLVAPIIATQSPIIRVA